MAAAPHWQMWAACHRAELRRRRVERLQRAAAAAGALLALLSLGVVI